MADVTNMNKAELKKYLDDQIKDILDKEFKSRLKSKDSEAIIKEVIAKTLTNFYKALYLKSSIWSKDLK